MAFAYSVAADRPAARGTATRAVSLASLIEDERAGRYLVQVDVADGHGDGLPVLPHRARRVGLLPLAPSAVRCIELSAASGVWAAIVRRVSRPRAAWRLLEAGQDGAALDLVIDPEPAAWRARAAVELAVRPHPEVVVVDSIHAVPRVWRRAAIELLHGPDGQPG
ncbi:hypothetical protein [Curtobacterium sp. ISL-83]|uniref:hypothetical protein n=1 Tax=Curtobacterium sp. ISL-83 TaxID=2819145 RepID=UPI001BECF718|nr:hypothetical protein [Curtobacterium sp. ISL-83]MBT2501883.1 hypothetical protein [Curtobacterium sp. ISL-83]